MGCGTDMGERLRGEEENECLRVDIDPRIRLRSVGSKVTSEAELLA
jgi:hypothetical protein